MLIDGYVSVSHGGRASLPEVYVSNWYILGGVLLPPDPVRHELPAVVPGGLGNTVVQGYYMHNAMGMWFTQIALGISYYAIPRLLGRPIYSYALGVLGFWTNLLFYPLIGAHHFIFSPEAWWLQTTAILFSVGMMVPVWAGTGNLLLTFKGGAGVVRRSYALPFFVTGTDRLWPFVDTGNDRGVPQRQHLLALHELHRGPLSCGDVRLHRLHRLGRRLRALAAFDRTRAESAGGRRSLLARAGRRPDLRDRDLGGRSAPGLRVGGRSIIYRVGDRRRADVALANDRRSADGEQPRRLRL